MSSGSASGDDISMDRIVRHVGALLPGNGAIRKWHDAIRYRIVGLDDATRKELSNAFIGLGHATGLNIAETFDRNDNNLLIIFTEDTSLYAKDEWVKKMFKLQGEDDKTFSERFARELKGGSKRFAVASKQDGRVLSVAEFLYTPANFPASPPIARGARLASIAFHDLTDGSVSDFLPSVMNNNLANATPTRADIAFIRALYDPEIAFNMSRAEAVPIIARKMSEQLLPN